MGTTSAKVSDRFNFLATFASSNPTKNDIKRLERHVNKALCRIKCMNLSKDKVKMLLSDGFDSSELIEWGKELIDGVINSDNAESCILLYKLIKRKADEIGYMKALPRQWRDYSKILRADKLSIDLSSLTKIIGAVVIIFVFLFLHVLRSNQTRVEKSDIETAQIMLKEGENYLSRFFPSIKTPELARPYVGGINGATKSNPNIDIWPGSLVVSSYGIINSPYSSSTHKDMTAIGQYITTNGTIESAISVYLPESIYFNSSRLYCYYDQTTGVIRYLENSGNDFTGILKLIEGHTKQPWVNLPNIYPLSRTKDDGTPTPYSYIYLPLLTDATALLREAKIIQMPFAEQGCRIIYEENNRELFIFYTTNEYKKKFIEVQYGEIKVNEDIKVTGLSCRAEFLFVNDDISSNIKIDGVSDEGLYKIRTTNSDTPVDMITIGSYGYLVVRYDFDSKNNTHKTYLTDAFKKLIIYQKEEQYATQTAS